MLHQSLIFLLTLICWFIFKTPFNRCYLLRAFPPREVKFLAYIISKYYFLVFNISLYNTSYIKNSIFLPFHLNIVFLFSCFFLFVSPFLWKPTTFFANPHPRLATTGHHHWKQKKLKPPTSATTATTTATVTTTHNYDHQPPKS